MGRKLKEIEVEEISLVDAASNRKKFLIIKKELGEGTGVGGPRQGIGGAKYCVCPKCGYSIEHAQIGEGKSKPCASIKCPKCGTKMAGSKTKELSKLKKAHISIDSDGTVKGTKILVGGEEVNDLVDFSFSFYQPRSGDVEALGKNVSCTYSKVTETEDGFKHTDHFYLSKSLEVKKGMKDLKEQLKDLLGEDFSEEEFEKAQKKLDEKVVNALKGALNILNKYKGDFPDELKKAVGILAKHAGYGNSAQKSKEPYKLEEVLEVLEKTHLEKAGAKLSKNTREQIQKAIDALKKLLDADLKKGEGDGELKKELEEIKESIKKLGEKGKDEDLKKELDKITKRLETIEKAKGIKKSIDGDEDGDGKEKPKWSGFFPGEE